MTTPRPHARTRRAVLSLVVAASGLISLAGCDPRTLMYFLQPFDPTIPPPPGAPDLTGKRVVVVTHAVSGALGEFQSIDREITREIVSIFRERIKKIDVVDPDKVWKWLEAHPNWTDQAEIAKAFEAEVVVFLEVEGFQIQSPNDINVFQGEAKTHILVTALEYPKNSKGRLIKDQPKEAKQIYDEYRDTEFPRRGPIPFDTGVSRGAFKNRFVKVVAAEISWHFADHPTGDDIQDVKFNNQ